MEDSLSTVAQLVQSGYRLTLYKNTLGACWAELRRGWIFKKRVRVDLDRDEFEQAKHMLNGGATWRLAARP